MKVPLIILSMSLMLACSTTPQPIHYGSDACVFCQMTIVDRQHAAQVVTVKGKSYKYDAIECMMNDLRRWKHPDAELLLVSDYASPGTLTDATTAHYLISEDIPSPMGEFLTAFSTRELRDAQSVEKGEKLNWEALRIKFQHTH